MKLPGTARVPAVSNGFREMNALSLALAFGLSLASPGCPADPAIRVEGASACVLRYTDLARLARFQFHFVWDLETDEQGHVRSAVLKRTGNSASAIVQIDAMEREIRLWRLRPAGRYVVLLSTGSSGMWPEASITRKGTREFVRFSPLSPCGAVRPDQDVPR